MRDLSRNPSVDGTASFLRCLHNDPSKGPFHVLVHQTTGINAQAAVDVLKFKEIKTNQEHDRLTAPYPHVIFHATRNHQNVGNFVYRSKLVQQAKVGWHFWWKERREGLLMKQIINVAPGFISTSISRRREISCVIQLK